MAVSIRVIFFLGLTTWPVLSVAQYTLKGRVKDSTDFLPGVNVHLADQNRSTVTTTNGIFEIDSNTPSASVTFSFIGFATQVRTVSVSEEITVTMLEDKRHSTAPEHHLKHSLSMGYFGDIPNANVGGIVGYHLQSIGKADIEICTSFKYWNSSGNSGLEFSIDKVLSGNTGMWPPHVFVSYRDIRYAEALEMKQVRALLTTELGKSFSFDVGSGYQRKKSYEESRVFRSRHYSAVVGVSKTFGIFNDVGMNASFNFHPRNSMFELAAYKAIHVKKLPAMVVMAKYVDFNSLSALTLSLRIHFFSTHYYCCSSWMTALNDLTHLK